MKELVFDSVQPVTGAYDVDFRKMGNGKRYRMTCSGAICVYEGGFITVDGSRFLGDPALRQHALSRWGLNFRLVSELGRMYTPDTGEKVAKSHLNSELYLVHDNIVLAATGAAAGARHLPFTITFASHSAVPASHCRITASSVPREARDAFLKRTKEARELLTAVSAMESGGAAQSRTARDIARALVEGRFVGDHPDVYSTWRGIQQGTWVKGDYDAALADALSVTRQFEWLYHAE